MRSSQLPLTIIRVATLASALIASTVSPAQGIIWGNSATFGPDIAHKIDKTTGALIQNYTVSNGNGRGIVVVGNVMYTTQVGDPKIYKTDITTGLSLGTITTSVGSMSTIAWDGTHFWTSDYSGPNQAFRIDTSGTVVKTITLSLAGTNIDGMEYFNGKLIANRGDAVGPYDVYDLDGNVLQAAFISPTLNPTGIAFDGTDFYTSNIFNSSLSIWDGTTGAFKSTLPLTGGNFLVEDLSVDYAARQDTGGTSVPDGGSTAVLLTGALVALCLGSRRTSHKA